MKRTLIILKALFIAVLIYVSIAEIIYRFRHPEQTETELLLNFFKALIFE